MFESQRWSRDVEVKHFACSLGRNYPAKNRKLAKGIFEWLAVETDIKISTD